MLTFLTVMSASMQSGEPSLLWKQQIISLFEVTRKKLECPAILHTNLYDSERDWLIFQSQVLRDELLSSFRHVDARESKS